jgi:hypothetical protein
MNQKFLIPGIFFLLISSAGLDTVIAIVQQVETRSLTVSRYLWVSATANLVFAGLILGAIWLIQKIGEINKGMAIALFLIGAGTLVYPILAIIVPAAHFPVRAGIIPLVGTRLSLSGAFTTLLGLRELL